MQNRINLVIFASTLHESASVIGSRAELFEGIRRFAPVDLAKPLGVTNRTIINWCAGLVRAGFLHPETGGRRIRFYARTEP